MKSIGRVWNQQFSCEVSRKRLGTNRIAVKSVGRVLETSRKAVKSLDRALGPTG